MITTAPLRCSARDVPPGDRGTKTHLWPPAPKVPQVVTRRFEALVRFDGRSLNGGARATP